MGVMVCCEVDASSITSLWGTGSSALFNATEAEAAFSLGSVDESAASTDKVSLSSVDAEEACDWDGLTGSGRITRTVAIEWLVEGSDKLMTMLVY